MNAAVTLIGAQVEAPKPRSLTSHEFLLGKPKLLIVNEFGYLPLEPQAAHLFFTLVGVDPTFVL